MGWSNLVIVMEEFRVIILRVNAGTWRPRGAEARSRWGGGRRAAGRDPGLGCRLLGLPYANPRHDTDYVSAYGPEMELGDSFGGSTVVCWRDDRAVLEVRGRVSGTPNGTTSRVRGATAGSRSKHTTPRASRSVRHTTSRSGRTAAGAGRATERSGSSSGALT